MSRADQWIRWSTVVAVVVVALVAASFSYMHALDVITAHSRPSRRLNLVAPLCIDGVVYSSSMVLLNDARRGLDAHWLAWFGLTIGILATLGINVISGLPYGIFGAVVSAWPAVALVLSDELLMIIVRRSAQPEGEQLLVDAKTGPPAVADRRDGDRAVTSVWPGPVCGATGPGDGSEPAEPGSS